MDISPFSSQFHTSSFAPRLGTQQIAENRSAHQAELIKLRNRDREVRAHEHAHLSAAGGLATGGATFSFQSGPDGKLYAVGGEVSLDTSPVPNDPEATIQKAKQIRAAALAPANPSAQDRAVAASAAVLEAQARREIQTEKKEESSQLEDSTQSTTHHIDVFA